MSSVPGLIAALCLGLMACTTEPTTPVASTQPTMITAAPPGSTQPTPLEWVVDDLSGVASDGRGTYVDLACGVSATLNDTGGFLIPANAKSSCGYVRSVSVNLGTQVDSAVNRLGALGIAAIASGTTGLIDFNVQPGVSNCAILRYNAETGAQVQATASTTLAGARQWVVASVAPHLAGCYVSKKNGFVWDGIQRAVPLRVTLTTR